MADIIKTQPEGTLHKDLNHYFEGAYVNKSDGYIYDHLGDGYVSDIVEAADGSLYIKNPFGNSLRLALRQEQRGQRRLRCC